jgi:hypothetical protein
MVCRRPHAVRSAGGRDLMTLSLAHPKRAYRHPRRGVSRVAGAYASSRGQQMMRISRTRRNSHAVLAAVGVVAVALELAACGGGGSAPTTSTSSTVTSSSTSSNRAGGPAAAATRSGLAACLKRHGVTLPSGAGRGGGGFAPPSGGEGPPSGAGGGAPGGPPAGFGATGGSGSAGFAGGNSKFAAALRACGGGGFAGRGAPTGPTGSGGLSLSSARERAVITNYARCMNTHGVKLPKPNFSGSGSVFGTSVKRSSKSFISANRICQADLRPSSSPGG